MAAQQNALQGTYRWVDTAAERKVLSDAVAAATATLDPSVHDLWQVKLWVITTPPPQMTLNHTAGQIVFAAATEKVSTQDNGTVGALSDGWQIKQQFSGAVLVRQVIKDSLVQEYRYQLNADGKTLIVTANVTSPELPRPIQFQVTYKRL